MVAAIKKPGQEKIEMSTETNYDQMLRTNKPTLASTGAAMYKLINEASKKMTAILTSVEDSVEQEDLKTKISRDLNDLIEGFNAIAADTAKRVQENEQQSKKSKNKQVEDASNTTGNGDYKDAASKIEENKQKPNQSKQSIGGTSQNLNNNFQGTSEGLNNDSHSQKKRHEDSDEESDDEEDDIDNSLIKKIDSFWQRGPQRIDYDRVLSKVNAMTFSGAKDETIFTWLHYMTGILESKKVPKSEWIGLITPFLKKGALDTAINFTLNNSKSNWNAFKELLLRT